MEDYKDYIVYETVHGYRYMYKKRLIARDEIPDEIVIKLHMAAMIEEQQPHTCIICGQHSETTRLLNGQSLALCNEDYYGMTMGELVKNLRERAIRRESSWQADTNQNPKDEASLKPSDNPKPPVTSKRSKKPKAKRPPLEPSRTSSPSVVANPSPMAASVENNS